MKSKSKIWVKQNKAEDLLTKGIGINLEEFVLVQGEQYIYCDGSLRNIDGTPVRKFPNILGDDSLKRLVV